MSICDNCGEEISEVEGGDCQYCGIHCCDECLEPDAHDCEENPEAEQGI